MGNVSGKAELAGLGVAGAGFVALQPEDDVTIWESSVEEALVEMYLAGVSVRRVEDITEALWGTRVSSGTVSCLNQKIYRHIEAWRNREIVGDFPYVYLDGVILKRSWAGRFVTSRC